MSAEEETSPIERARAIREQIEDDPNIYGALAELVAELARVVEDAEAYRLAHEAEHGYSPEQLVRRTSAHPRAMSAETIAWNLARELNWAFQRIAAGDGYEETFNDYGWEQNGERAAMLLDAVAELVPALSGFPPPPSEWTEENSRDVPAQPVSTPEVGSAGNDPGAAHTASESDMHSRPAALPAQPTPVKEK